MKRIFFASALSLTLIGCADQPDPVTPDDGEAPPVIDPALLKVIDGRVARQTLGIDAARRGAERAAIAAAGPALPVFPYTVTAAQDGGSYSGILVGQNPATGASTTIPTVLIPVILRITQGGTTFVFDPTAPDPGCIGASTPMQLTQASPLFTSTAFTINGQSVGTTQYADAIMRAEFFTQIPAADNYHVLLSTSNGAALTLSINAGRTGNQTARVVTLSGTQCGTGATRGKLAIVNINTIDAALQRYIASNGLNPSQFPFFVTYNAVMSNGSATTGACCILGYHNALGTPGQTYGIAEFEGRNQTVFVGVSDVATATHEVNEWTNDPAGTNPTPPWGGIGQQSRCQSNLEDGDPLSGTLMPTVTLGGFTYHLQELAFFSWFYGGASLGTGGRYSSNGTFAGPAKLCPPGRTN
jgi:hypothetical protein